MPGEWRDKIPRMWPAQIHARGLYLALKCF